MIVMAQEEKQARQTDDKDENGMGMSISFCCCPEFKKKDIISTEFNEHAQNHYSLGRSN